MRFRDLSISAKVRSVIVVTSSLALLLTSVIFLYVRWTEARSGLAVELRSLSARVAEDSLDELLFDEPESAQTELAELAARKHVTHAWITKEGKAFASYSRDGSSPPEAAAQASDAPLWQDDSLIVVEQILSEGSVIGTLGIRANLDELRARMAVYSRYAVLGFLLSFLASIFLAAWMQRLIAGPIRKLTATAKQVSDSQDYSLRMNAHSRDEVGTLIQSFNAMLEQIQQRDAAIAAANEKLREYNRSLEQKVSERTSELAELAEAERNKAELLERAHQYLQSTQTQLVQSEKMASLGQLVAGVAHEINNPINFISSGLPSLRRRFDKLAAMVPESERSVAYEKTSRGIVDLLEIVQEGASRTAQIVKNLRIFSRLDEAELKTADIHESIDSTLNLLHHQTKERIEVIKKYGDLPPVHCYIGELSQVFMNTLSNGIQAIDGEGTITVSTRMIDPEHIEIEICDSGEGMSEDVQRNIFDPFFTTKPVGEGTGLGLSISHGIIEKHKGVIRVQSQPGEGTCFSIEVPVNLQSED